jgi:hypothetical protein
MVLLVESEPEEMTVTARTPDVAKPDEVRTTKVETRVHQRQCDHCHRWFWAWDPERRKCFVCDAPPPAELKRILGLIHGTTG